MCDQQGYRCKPVGCTATANLLIGCDGGSPCFSCAVGLMNTTEMPKQDATGAWQAPAGAIKGVLVSGLGWLITEPGKSGLQVDDIVISISEDGGESFLANLAYFALHWTDLQSDEPTKEYCLTYYRRGARELQTLTITRP